MEKRYHREENFILYTIGIQDFYYNIICYNNNFLSFLLINEDKYVSRKKNFRDIFLIMYI